MSRTVRRKKINWCGNNNSVDHEVQKRARNMFYLVSRDWPCAHDYEEEKQDCLYYEARFHREKKQYRHRSIPGWFCNLYYHRRARACVRADIRRNYITENWDGEIIGIKAERHADLSWSWW